MPKIIGIDLGTTFSAMAAIESGGEWRGSHADAVANAFNIAVAFEAEWDQRKVKA